MTDTMNTLAMPTRVLLVSTALVGGSTGVLHEASAYGTLLGQSLMLGAWRLAASVTSARYADTHDAFVWLIALVLNVLLYAVPAGLAWFAGRRRWPAGTSMTLAGLCAFHAACLLWLVPASDGP